MKSNKAARVLLAREARALKLLWLVSLVVMSGAALWQFFAQPAGIRFSLLDSERVRIFAYGGAMLVGGAAAYLQVQDERKEGTWGGYWLLPVDRRVLWLAKSAVGLFSIVVGAVLPAALLVLLVVGSSNRGGPVPLSGVLHPLGAAMAGALAYFSVWLAADRDEARIIGTRLIPILSALAITVIAVALKSVHVLLTAAVLGFAIAVVAAAVFHVSVRRGAHRARPSVAIALAMVPALALASLLALELSTAFTRPPVGTARYETLDADGLPIAIERTDGSATATSLTTGESRELPANERQLVMAGLQSERVDPHTRLRQFEQGGVRAFYDTTAGTHELYDTRTGVHIGCLGDTGFQQRDCKPLVGRLFDVVMVGSHHLLLTEGGVYRVDAGRREIALVMRAELSDAHATLDERAPIVVRHGGTVEAIDAAGRVVASCLDVGAGPVLVGVTRTGSLAGIKLGDGTTFRCDTAGEVTATGTLNLGQPVVERSVQERTAEAIMGTIPVVVSRSSDVLQPVDPFPALVLSTVSAAAAGLLLWLLRDRRAGLIAALTCVLFGPLALVSLAWVYGPALRRSWQGRRNPALALAAGIVMVGCSEPAPVEPQVAVVAPKTTGGPIALTAEPSATSTEQTSARPDLAVVVVLDRSGSMSGEPIDMARLGLADLARRMAPEDIFEVIVFDSAPTKVVGAAPRKSQPDAAAQIASIEARGGTNALPALDVAYQDIAALTASRKHIIFVTDGLFPVAGIPELATAMRGDDITLTTVALGEADRQLLTSLAEQGGGRFHHLPDPGSLAQMFRSELERVRSEVPSGG